MNIFVIASRRRSAYAVSAVLAALIVPATGLAASGGAAPGGGSSVSTGTTSSTTSTTPAPTAQSGNSTVTASGNGITLSTMASGILRKGLTFTGTAPQSMAGDTIEIDRLGHQTNWAWAETVTAVVQSDGTFSAVWTTNHIGRFQIRAIQASPTSASTADAPPTVTTTVYRPAKATQYGPGFYGHKTACGQRLRPGTVGVANRTLKCGTSVAIYYNGRTITVPVIDRGPYANSADWDLTMATGKALGLSGTATIDAVSLPAQQAQATSSARSAH